MNAQALSARKLFLVKVFATVANKCPSMAGAYHLGAKIATVSPA